LGFYSVYFSAYKMNKKNRIHVFVSGRVQGIGYRDGVRRKAGKLGIFGWVKNLEDGRVEAIFEGEEGGIEEIVEWVKTGPFLAKVEKIDIVPENFSGEFKDFKIIFNK